MTWSAAAKKWARFCHAAPRPPKVPVELLSEMPPADLGPDSVQR